MRLSDGGKVELSNRAIVTHPLRGDNPCRLGCHGHVLVYDSPSYRFTWVIAFPTYDAVSRASVSRHGRGEHHANVSYTTIIPCPIPGHLARIRTSHNGNLGPVIYARGTGIGPQGPKTALTPTLYRPATLADPWYAQPPRPVAPARPWGHEPQVARPWRRLPLFSSCPDPASQRERPGGQV